MPLTDHTAPIYELKAGLFKALSHPIRIRILELLAECDELSVADLQAELDLEASHVSQHLAVIRRYQLVTSQRRGSHVYYAIAYPQVKDFLRTARELLEEIVDSNHRATSAHQELKL